jgi:hypothetical protein
VESEERDLQLRALEAEMRRPLQQRTYPLTAEEKRIWLAEKARVHGDDF